MVSPAPSVPRQGLVFFDFITHFGGAQRSTLSVCQALSPFYRVQVVDPYGVCRPWLQAIQEAGIAIQVLMPHSRQWFIGHQGRPLRRIWSLLAQVPQQRTLRRRLRQCLDRARPDWVMTNSPKALALLWLTGGFRRTKIVFYARGWYQRHQVPAWGRALIRKTHGVLAVSHATAQAMQAWGVAPERIHVVHTLMDPDGLEQESKAAAPARPPHADRPCRILLPAQLVRSKGQHTALHAAALLKDKGLDFVMWLAGDIKMGADGGYRQELDEAIRQQGLADHVFLLGHRTDVPGLMRCADVVILPTESEGLPRAVWEAQVLGRPVIATPVGGVTDLIEDGTTGLLVPVADGKALAEAIHRVTADAALRQRLVQCAAARIHDEFSMNRQREALRQALEQMR